MRLGLCVTTGLDFFISILTFHIRNIIVSKITGRVNLLINGHAFAMCCLVKLQI